MSIILGFEFRDGAETHETRCSEDGFWDPNPIDFECIRELIFFLFTKIFVAIIIPLTASPNIIEHVFIEIEYYSVYLFRLWEICLSIVRLVLSCYD